MATQLYETDFYGWTQEQAAKLRALLAERSNLDLDMENIAEEIEDVGKSRRNEVESRLETVLEHLLKLAFSPAWEPIGQWKRTVRVQRRDLLGLLEESPSLWNVVREELADAYRHAEGQVKLSHIDLTMAALPTECPFLLEEEILMKDWFPEPLVRPSR